MNLAMKMKLSNKKTVILGVVMVCIMAIAFTILPAFADNTVPPQLTELLDSMIFYVGLIFQTVGILLGIYAVGQMIMAFKDENPDAKTKATTLLVVAIILVGLPAIIKGIDLQGFLTGE